MKKVQVKNALALTYKIINDAGSNQSKSVVINDLNTELTDEDFYGIAVKVKDLMAVPVENILRRYEDLFLEN